MFTGIVEDVGVLESIEKDRDNLILTVKSRLSKELSIDQSVSHNGICLTVVESTEETYKIVAIKETVSLTNLSDIAVGDPINLERCLKIGDRIDGHMVQGHVDGIARCISKTEEGGSHCFTFRFDRSFARHIISKGSITINGVSLTVINPTATEFQVAIIPYTYDNTIFKYLKLGEDVNLEFDILGKYINRRLDLMEASS
jgi:riboflavin synthase